MTVLASTRPVTLIGGAPFPRTDLEAALALAPGVVAADGGADQALALGVMPQAVIGDFDSLSDEARAAIPADRLHHVTEQLGTDFEKCLSRIDAPLVLAVGFSGARQDHFLAALNALARRVGPRCILIAGDDVITLAPETLALDLAPGTRVSLVPMGDASGRSTGLKWPIDQIAFAPDGRVGTSNQATGRVELRDMSGPMLLILPRAQLKLLAAAL
ncbi:thiamine diphosphokinase [Paracoccus sp. CPCC 101403]|uniref:Thiamine diphosphokinase n=1 Tax=Paracoccus broussonetiae TaxID=3075834 RepID=A0ABU3EGT3_9RHOB|nr:thiamine diphosphokinase [Paracoccus sp. CPCC 101403]MDT1063444.1 thiamine diphosphokinase [Paracoccus sp. CPCC 101403]